MPNLRCFGLFLSFGFACAPLGAAELELHYQFNGDATDALGNAAFNGTLENSAGFAPGVFGSALLANDGANQYVNTSVSPGAINFAGNAPKTTSAWVRTSVFSNAGIFGMGQGDDGEMWSLRVQASTNDWRAQHWGPPDYDFNTPGFSGNWAHLVIVHDGSQGRTYFNGQLVGSENSTLNTTVTEGDRNLEIGRYNVNDGDIWDGEIDDVAFWSGSVLTEAQINAMYHLGLPSSFDNLSSAFGFNLDAGQVDELFTIHEDQAGQVSFDGGDNFWSFADELTAINGGTPLGQPFQIGDETFVQLSNAGTGTGLLLAAAPVPEPASIAIWSLIGLALCGFGCYRFRSKKH